MLACMLLIAVGGLITYFSGTWFHLFTAEKQKCSRILLREQALHVFHYAFEQLKATASNNDTLPLKKDSLFFSIKGASQKCLDTEFSTIGLSYQFTALFDQQPSCCFLFEGEGLRKPLTEVMDLSNHLANEYLKSAYTDRDILYAKKRWEFLQQHAQDAPLPPCLFFPYISSVCEDSLTFYNPYDRVLKGNVLFSIEGSVVEEVSLEERMRAAIVKQPFLERCSVEMNLSSKDFLSIKLPGKPNISRVFLLTKEDNEIKLPCPKAQEFVPHRRRWQKKSPALVSKPTLLPSLETNTWLSQIKTCFWQPKATPIALETLLDMVWNRTFVDKQATFVSFNAPKSLLVQQLQSLLPELTNADIDAFLESFSGPYRDGLAFITAVENFPRMRPYLYRFKNIYGRPEDFLIDVFVKAQQTVHLQAHVVRCWKDEKEAWEMKYLDFLPSHTR